MAAGAYQFIRPFSPEIYAKGTVLVPEKASATYKVGALLVYNAGYVEEAGAAPATVKFIAAEDGHNGATDGAKSCLVWPISVDGLWEITMKDAYAVALNGANSGLVKDATTKAWYVDDADVGDQVTFEGVLDTPGLGAIGDTKFQGKFRFQTANIAGA